MMLVLALTHRWFMQQLDFELAYLQARMLPDIFMQVPAHFNVVDGILVQNEAALRPHHHDYVLLFLQQLHG